MKIAVRMDDITPDMDWKKFKEVKALLDAHGIKPLIGVVPDNRDENLNRSGKAENHREPDFWAYIRTLQENGWCIALHGYRHVYTQKRGGRFPLNRFSEFAGLPYKQQYAMLEEGKRILLSHGILTDIFMAPAHSYDKNTLKALRELGFSGVTDGFGKRPYVLKGLTFYPISFRLESSLKKKDGITTMVIHSNTVNEKDMEKYKRIFEQKDMISYHDYLKEPAGKRGMAGQLAEYMSAGLKRILVKCM